VRISALEYIHHPENIMKNSDHIATYCVIEYKAKAVEKDSGLPSASEWSRCLELDLLVIRNEVFMKPKTLQSASTKFGGCRTSGLVRFERAGSA
jgi:hypothetical protein